MTYKNNVSDLEQQFCMAEILSMFFCIEIRM